MAFDELNLTPFSKVVSTAGTRGMANIPSLENKALLALERSKYWNEKEREANEIWAGVQFPTQPVKTTSWGDVAMGALGTASQAGLFDGGFGGGNQFSGRGSSGTDAWGRDFDDPQAGFYGKWIEDTPSNAWYNPFGWGS